MKHNKKRDYDSTTKEPVLPGKKDITPKEDPDKTKPEKNDFSIFRDPTITSIQPKKPRNINEDLIKRNEERIDEEINLINVQTDDTEDELDEEENDKRNEEK